MSSALSTAPKATRRLALAVAGQVLTRWTSVSVSRNLRDIAGSFTVQYRDAGREALAFSPDLDSGPAFAVVKAGQACTVSLDGTMVLKGFIDEVDVNWSGNALTCTISGRDATGDLVDCAASPNGPVEWRNQSPLQLAQIFCRPFGITATADVDVGGVFPVFAIDQDEIALSAIEKAARQAALLVTSNGVGGLVLTRGGSSRAPAPLTRPGNILDGGIKSSWAQRFSDYYVKGQTNKSVTRAHSTPLITSVTNPTEGATFPVETSTTATTTETVSSIMTGHAIDPEVTRYRPTVRSVKTQSGAATVTEQAYWALRVAKGMAESLQYRVLDWRAGSANALWLPNALSHVTDPFVGIDKDMLISGVTYGYDGTGEFTSLELAGRTAFDRINEPADDPRYIQTRKPKSFGPTRQG
jgi:prophage tail gpP-like protein